MAEVNTSIWGDSTDWHSNGTYTTIDDKYKIKNTDAVIDLWQDTKLVVNTPWDKTLSYCGLGTESPLSHITFLRQLTPYYYDAADWDGSKFSEMIIDYTTTDDREATNFAIGFTEIYSGRNQFSCQFKSDMASLTLEQYGPIFQRWSPQAKTDEAMQWIIDHEQPGSSADPWCNVASSVMFAQVPVKNFVAIPYIVCGNSINTKFLENRGDLQTVDLKTYLTEEQVPGDEHASYLTHPYIFQVLLKFVYSGSETNFESHTREGLMSPSTCFILDETNMYSDINPDCKADDEEGYDFTTAYMYNQLMNWISWSEGMPIMGLTSGPAGWFWRDGWQIGFSLPWIGVPSGTDIPDLKDVHGRFNFPIWIGSEDLETKIIQNENPQSYSEADDGCIIYYMSAGNDPAVFREKIRRAVACFGLFFVDGEEDRNLALDDNKMMLGILEDGIGHGDYSFGLNNRLQDQWNWDDMHENDYDPVGPQPEPGDDPAASDNPLLPVGLTWTLAGKGTSIWALTPAEIDQVWEDIFGSEVKLDKFGDNPLNAIISLKWTPFVWSSQDLSPIILGVEEANPGHVYQCIKSLTSAEKHGYGQMRFKFNKNFYNARNMQARLFLPFYGYYELPAAQLLSSQLRVDFYYNVPDELGVWVISYDKVIYDFVECSCNMEIPITGTNAAAIHESKVNEALTIATQIASLAATSMAAYSGVKGVIAMGDAIGAEVTGIASDIYGPVGENVTGQMAYGAFRGAAVGSMVTAGLNTAGSGVNIYNTVRQAQIQRAALRTNLPYHGSALQTTFLHMSMVPYVQIFKNTIMDGLETANGGTVRVELGGSSETEYKLKVGHACNMFATINTMPENSLLQTTGLANNPTTGMELAEVNELNTILQSGFLK